MTLPSSDVSVLLAHACGKWVFAQGIVNHLAAFPCGHHEEVTALLGGLGDTPMCGVRLEDRPKLQIATGYKVEEGVPAGANSLNDIKSRPNVQ